MRSGEPGTEGSYDSWSATVALQKERSEEVRAIEEWSHRKIKQREALAEDVRAEHGESEFQIKGCLRTTLAGAQRIDPELAKLTQAKEKDIPHGFRRADHGVLERNVVVGQGDAWVVIVPDGNATAHMSWKRWCFMQVHTGVLGGHRSANKTMSALKRIVWWQTMHTDVETWCLRCHTCQRFRKVAQRQEAPSVIPIEAELSLIHI